jgi:hypothetical protein
MSNIENIETSVTLQAPPGVRTLGMRISAKHYSTQIQTALAEGSVVVDFAGLDVTQGFVDELLGGIALKHGQEIFKRISFKGCTSDTRQIVTFVISDRLAQRDSPAP